jgi:hypothetical protein
MRSDALWHSLDAENYREAALPEPAAADNRSKARFPIDLPFRYRAADQPGLSGSGRVVNIGSSDVVVACRHQLKLRTPVELVIEWPARLDGRIPIRLIMSGRVVRADLTGFAVGSCQHRFQIVGVPASAVRAEAPTLPAAQAEMTSNGRVTGQGQYPLR